MILESNLYISFRISYYISLLYASLSFLSSTLGSELLFWVFKNDGFGLIDCLRGKGYLMSNSVGVVLLEQDNITMFIYFLN